MGKKMPRTDPGQSQRRDIVREERPAYGQPPCDPSVTPYGLAVGALVPIRREQPGAMAGLGGEDAGRRTFRLHRGRTCNRLLRGLGTPEVRKHITADILSSEGRGDTKSKGGDGGK